MSLHSADTASGRGSFLPSLSSSSRSRPPPSSTSTPPATAEARPSFLSGRGSLVARRGGGHVIGPLKKPTLLFSWFGASVELPRFVRTVLLHGTQDGLVGTVAHHSCCTGVRRGRRFRCKSRALSSKISSIVPHHRSSSLSCKINDQGLINNRFWLISYGKEPCFKATTNSSVNVIDTLRAPLSITIGWYQYMYATCTHERYQPEKPAVDVLGASVVAGAAWSAQRKKLQPPSRLSHL